MGRSIKKGPYIDHNLEEKVEDMNGGKERCN
jgi:ribosomal protein S19